MAVGPVPPIVNCSWRPGGCGSAQASPAAFSAQISTTGASAGLNVPVGCGFFTSGGRKKKCGLPPLCAPSKMGAVDRVVIGDGDGDVGSASAHANSGSATSATSRAGRRMAGLLRASCWDVQNTQPKTTAGAPHTAHAVDRGQDTPECAGVARLTSTRDSSYACRSERTEGRAQM